MKTAHDLTTEFFEETGVTSINSQGEPDIEYVQWLENKLCEVSNRTSKLEELVGVCEAYNQLSKQGEIRTKEELALWIALPEKISELRKKLNLK